MIFWNRMRVTYVNKTHHIEETVTLLSITHWKSKERLSHNNYYRHIHTHTHTYSKTVAKISFLRSTTILNPRITTAKRCVRTCKRRVTAKPTISLDEWKHEKFDIYMAVRNRTYRKWKPGVCKILSFYRTRDSAPLRVNTSFNKQNIGPLSTKTSLVFIP